MTSFTISQIKPSDKRAHNQLTALLSKAGLPVDQPADFALGIYDHDYNLIATGALQDNELHSIAVAPGHRGKGLLNQIITHLHEHRFQNGCFDLYVTVRDELKPIFKSLGFHELERNCSDAVYMGNHHALQQYLACAYEEKAVS